MGPGCHQNLCNSKGRWTTSNYFSLQYIHVSMVCTITWIGVKICKTEIGLKTLLSAVFQQGIKAGRDKNNPRLKHSKVKNSVSKGFNMVLKILNTLKWARQKQKIVSHNGTPVYRLPCYNPYLKKTTTEGVFPCSNWTIPFGHRTQSWQVLWCPNRKGLSSKHHFSGAGC